MGCNADIEGLELQMRLIKLRLGLMNPLAMMGNQSILALK